ncbi:lysine 5,6-aminomutase subunit alpha [Mariniplasma anaerobium]|uniref:L-beta-lysine 5,6-aminomutase alpha subunit n=1 Tax=Mariniplasma anaerobium TaxID=2735436 RepID=A0A7U9TI40_9MOLU|nr:lysine 5,6-aminomutase subunit alpha [Mariniplasma anaerobium]BCR36705.1 L-beta-lysine 5,6-aminomutase alpha subunit [Mariniplasma anaerobium]
MSKLNLDLKTIETCRLHASHIATQVQNFIDINSTVSVERAVLRLLGVDDVNELGIPLVNIVVDHIKEEADISLGICHYISYAKHEYGLSPLEIAKRVSHKKLNLSKYTNKSKSAYLSNLTQYYKPEIKKIDEMKSFRESQIKLTPKTDTPEKYVIVATGNIYEDIKQAVSAAKKGAQIIAVIRSTGQSLLDYVPHGATTEGFGGTYATQENFKLMRKALDEVSLEEKRYIKLVNYASGLCMPEIAALGAIERLDMMLNDSLYGIIFRDINMQRTFVDQYFSRVLSAYANITINTGEDNYLTTSDAYDHAHTVLASQFINEQFAKKALMDESLMGLGHAYEISPDIENSFLYELAQAEMAREIFPNAPLKYMPPTKHMTGDIFMGSVQNALFNIAAVTSKQSIHLLGMMTEAIHTPFISDRAIALDNASYIEKAFKDFGNEITYNPDGIIVKRANDVLNSTQTLLQQIEDDGMFQTLEKGVFAGISRHKLGGKGLDGVFEKHKNYQNPILDYFIKSLKEANHVKS